MQNSFNLQSTATGCYHCHPVLTQLQLTNISIYRVSQEERTKLREGVPYVKLYRYNPKHLYPKLNGYGDNGKRSLKLWQLLHTYWLPNSYWNWQEYVVSVMLISVLNIKVTCEWHKAIKLNYKNYSHSYLGVLRVTKHCTYREWWNAILSLWVELVKSKLANVRSARSHMSYWAWWLAVHSRRIERGNARCPHFSLAIISVTVQLWISVFRVISV